MHAPCDSRCGGVVQRERCLPESSSYGDFNSLVCENEETTSYCVPPFACVGYASRVTSMFGLVDDPCSAWSSSLGSSSSNCWACGTATSSQSNSSSLSLAKSWVDVVLLCVVMGVHAQTWESECH